MNSFPKIMPMLLTAALTIATFTSCGGDEPSAPSGSQSGTTAGSDIEKLVADNIKVTSTFDNPMWTFTITSTLEDKLPSFEIDYYLELSIDDRETTFNLENLDHNKRQSYSESYAGGVRTLILNTPFYEIHMALRQMNLTTYSNCTTWHDWLTELSEKPESTWDEYDRLYYDTARTKLAEEADALKSMKAAVTLCLTQSKPLKTHTFTLYEAPLSPFLPKE